MTSTARNQQPLGSRGQMPDRVRDRRCSECGQRRRTVRVPASSANLGPGFDVFAAALALHMELEVEETGRFVVETDLPIAKDRMNLAVRGGGEPVAVEARFYRALAG